MEEVGEPAAPVALEGSIEVAACLVDARVILGDMSIWLFRVLSDPISSSRPVQRS